MEFSKALVQFGTPLLVGLSCSYMIESKPKSILVCMTIIFCLFYVQGYHK